MTGVKIGGVALRQRPGILRIINNVSLCPPSPTRSSTKKICPENYYDFHTRSNTTTPRNPHYDVYSGRSATPRSGMDGYAAYSSENSFQALSDEHVAMENKKQGMVV